MNVQRTLGIKDYLQQKDVQERIQESLQDALSNVTVSISRAAHLFDFSESQLREWEKKGLLESDRTALSQDGKGHRQYTTNELSKLAVFQELIKKGKYSPAEILANLDAIWKHIEREKQNHIPAQSDLAISIESIPENLAVKKHIDQRVEHAEQEVFWRYFTAQTLRLSLMLICEDIPDTMAGLILPIGPDARFISEPIDLPTLNEAVIGWLNPNGSFNTFLDTNPSFEHPSDFRIEPLLAVDEEEFPADKTMIVVQRKAQPLNLNLTLVQTVRRLLKRVYNNSSDWYPSYGYGLRDYLYQATDFSSSTNPTDDVLNSLTDMVVELGGKSTASSAKNRWNFCCVLLPHAQDVSLPLQQRSLVIRAQSLQSPYKKLGNIVLSPDNPGLSLRAYQSGTMIYRPDMPEKDSIIAYKDQEKENLSALALPIAREDGLSIGVLYVASETPYAFTVEDQRVLRLIGTMVSELLLTYRARQGVAVKRTDLIDYPGIVDPSFKPFLTENDFIADLEALLAAVHAKDRSECTEKVEVSFIAIDIDNQSTLATKYGNRVARDLSREVGVRLRGLLNLFTNPKHQRLYHINTDRYCLILDEMSLDEARKKAEQLKVALAGDYLIVTQQSFSESTILPENMLKLPDITVRLGVPAYTLYKLNDILGRFDHETAVFEVRDVITRAIDEVLKQGRRDKGNVIISWDHDKWGYAKWTPSS